MSASTTKSKTIFSPRKFRLYSDRDYYEIYTYIASEIVCTSIIISLNYPKT